MPIQQVGNLPVRILSAGDPAGVIYNRSTTAQGFWGIGPDTANRADASILDPNATLAVDGSQDIWMVAASGTITVDYMPSGSAFFRALTQAFGALNIPAVFSPNFVHSVSGWSINEDGSAEFNNLTIRGTFFGADYILSSSGAYFYSGTPALGNLILSITNAAGVDPEGNTVPAAGLFLYETSGNALLGLIYNTIAGSQPLLALFPDSSFAFAGHSPFILSGCNNKGLTTENTFMELGPGNPPPASSSNPMLQLIGGSKDGATVQPHFSVFAGNGYGLVADFNASGLQAAHPGTNNDETWQLMGTVGTGFSHGSPAPAYKLYADNTVAFAGEINATSGTTSGTIITLPNSAYFPISTKKWTVPISAGTPAAAANVQVTINSSGQVILSAGPTGAAYSFALDTIRYPLDY